ncbi:MAG: hypothetical protein ACRDKL_00595 [Solirubrobacteraceae bacterium]
MDKIKAGADDATAKARATVQDVQAKRELGQAYGDLGRVAYELIQDGSLNDERLVPAAEHLRALLESQAGAAPSQ